MEGQLSQPISQANSLLFRVWRRLRLEFWRALGQVRPNSTKTFTLPNGALFEYPLNSVLGGLLSVSNFESIELNFVLKSLSPGDVFIDIGANGGLYSVLASKQVTLSGHVYSFEPGIRELKILHNNLGLNCCENVTIIPKAVSNEVGSAQFAVSHDGAMNSLKQTDHPLQKFKEWQTVEVTTIDQFVEDSSIERVDFIKIDVEGAESLVFKGAENLLSSPNKLMILFEACNINSDSFSFSTRDLVGYVKSKGFHVHYFDGLGNLVEISDDIPDGLGVEIYNFVACNRKI
jgi:FkbM family methyltransferase